MERAEHSWCPACRKYEPATKNDVPHRLHFLMMVVMAGFCLPFWVWRLIDHLWTCDAYGGITYPSRFNRFCFQAMAFTQGMIAVWVIRSAL